MKYVVFHFAIPAALTLVWLLSAGVVHAQSVGEIEVLVRPSDKNGSPVQSSLSKAGRSAEASDSLMQGIEGVSPIAPKRSLRKAGGTGSSTSLGAYRLQVTDSTTFRRVLARWKQHPDVDYAHPNYEYRVDRRSRDTPDPLSGNPYADSLDHLNVVGARDAWSFTLGDRDVTVGVIDTGVYFGHPDLEGQFWVNDAEDLNGNGCLDREDEGGGGDLNGVDDDGNGYVDDVVGYDFVDRPSPLQEGEYEDRDPHPSADPTGRGSGHGTSVAGIIAASPGGRTGIAGVAPQTRLVPLRAFGGDGIGSSDDIAAAIVYAVEMNVDVLNLSFGRSRAVPLIRDAIEYANDQGTVVVASAGNELTDKPHYPSDYPDVLSVAWLAEDGEGVPDFNRSQYGIGVDLGAPGTNVYTANFPASAVREEETPEVDALYHETSGSSFSAPQVAGAAALLRSADSSLTLASIRSILTGTARDLAQPGWDHRTGAGLLSVANSLARAYPARTEIVAPAHNQGFAGAAAVPIVGTAIDPSFQEYAVYVAEGTRNLDDRTDPWTQLGAAATTQARRDTLARWSVAGEAEGEYTLRLVVRRQDGTTVEDRRRIIVDRSPPQIDVEFLGWGRVQRRNEIVGDIVTGDRTRLTTRIRLRGETETLQSERITRRHGVGWPDAKGNGGTATVEMVATNTSGLAATLDTTLTIPPRRENTALLRRRETTVPRGVLLPSAPDFDGDGLPELVLNQSREGGISDTLRSFEWMGTGFAPNDTILAPLAPRDVGDTDQDGLQELLLQIRSGTLVLEQETPTAFPSTLVYADTLGGGTSVDEVIGGIRLTNFDQDDRGELLGTQGKTLEVLERTDAGASSFQSVLQLQNPTSVAGRDSTLGNAYDTPNAQPGDFDADGNRGLLAGDRDGDLVLYESTGDDAMEVVWTHETDRVDAGNRFAAGTFTNGESRSFATMATYFPKELPNGEFEASITYYSVWKNTGDNQYERAYRLPIAGPYAGRGAMTAADLDEDHRDEIVIAHAPSLLVLDWTPERGWRVLHHNSDGPPLQTRRLVAADFSGDGQPSILAESAGETLARFVMTAQDSTSPPQWASAEPRDDSTAVLTWRASGADSVTVFAGPPEPEGALNRLAAVTDSSYTATGSQERRYALRAWRSGNESPLSIPRIVRPHAPATVTNTAHPSPTSVQVRFSEPLQPGLRADQFRFGSEATPPTDVVRTQGGRAVLLRFPDAVAGRSASLTWEAIRDRTGLPVGARSTSVTFPAAGQRTLYVKEVTVLDPRRVRLRFNAALMPHAATDPSRYTIRPRGRVTSARQAENGDIVTLEIDGVVVGANGLETSLEVTGMQSVDGQRLASEGATVRLTQPADDLSNVYVYPNPYRARTHGPTMTIAGLPVEATVRIYSPDGRLVRVLDVSQNRDGGREWNLEDRGGERIPAGVYLFRVNAPNQSPVLEKAAVIR